MNIGELILKLHRNVLHEIKSVSKLNQITASQCLCIISIPYDGISQTNLAKKLSVDISTLSRNLDKLYNKKLINKESDYPDKRISKIFLTNDGYSLNSKLINDLNNNLSFLMNNNLINQNFIDQLSKLNWELMQKQINEH
tara:strand:- start:2213 stop:2632 length:420 start_codon:yes stop_codon:yes gene_type:complete